MKWHKETLQISTRGKGMTAMTEEVMKLIRAWQVQEGICHLFIQHTTASLAVNENYDPSAQVDMESFFERLVPDQQSWMVHTLEGKDDSSSHMRTLLTQSCLSVPIENGNLCLGNWQGIYLFEHRSRPRNRKVLVRVLEVEADEVA